MVQLTFATALAFLAAVQASPLTQRQDTPRFLSLPPTPELAAPISTKTFATADGAQLWFQKYNEQAGGDPIVFIHGGLGYSAYFADVMKIIAETRYVIAIDRRGHGRSTYVAGETFTFDKMAEDTFDLLQAEGVKSAIYAGWSDGSAETLAALINPKIAPSISKAFVFGGFQNPEDSNSTFHLATIYSEFVTRCGEEYAVLQPNADFRDFATRVGTLELTLPQFTDAQLGSIDGKKVQIVGADKEEAVNLDVPDKLHRLIPGSSLVMLKDVSHFAPVQDPVGFAAAIEAFVSGTAPKN
ncbi:hypothetical protein HYFRA_00008797 [Hymenoscyphus fraxineus]|uniref:AB hydrolase-1 domain-containing protein n=1 Tax=Hymenoscyphus fraxineus TaxID=746836 RepID=A0A9N9PUS8_9HELO|nr:hypothetical protein HYFRA_00008797 [Hymenoscyphus fraxineus]